MDLRAFLNQRYSFNPVDVIHRIVSKFSMQWRNSKIMQQKKKKKKERKKGRKRKNGTGSKLLGTAGIVKVYQTKVHLALWHAFHRENNNSTRKRLRDPVGERAHDRGVRHDHRSWIT